MYENQKREGKNPELGAADCPTLRPEGKRWWRRNQIPNVSVLYKEAVAFF